MEWMKMEWMESEMNIKRIFRNGKFGKNWKIWAKRTGDPLLELSLCELK
jgi:hypothetical protein